MTPKVQFNILESRPFSPLFNVLIRWENAAFISPANSSVIREKNGRGDGEEGEQEAEEEENRGEEGRWKWYAALE